MNFTYNSMFNLRCSIKFWNVDGAIARKVAIVWAMYMYLGQATKDVMEMPRPATPPVVKLEKR